MNSPKEVAQNYIQIGVGKATLPISKMLILGILAGMFIALGGVASVIASATIANPSLAKLISGLVFPGGLTMVLLAGSELFTGNNLIIISVMEKEVRVRQMLKNWLFVYIGNLIGSIFVALLIVYSDLPAIFGNAFAASILNTAVAKVSLPFGTAFVRGILCNFLVCIAVWIAYAAKDVAGKVIGLFFPILMFVISGFEHSVANMYYIAAGIFAKTNGAYVAAAAAGNDYAGLNWGGMFTGNLIPVTLGNLVGGAVLVGLGYWFVYVRKSSDVKIPVNAGKK